MYLYVICNTTKATDNRHGRGIARRGCARPKQRSCTMRRRIDGTNVIRSVVNRLVILHRNKFKNIYVYISILINFLFLFFCRITRNELNIT